MKVKILPLEAEKLEVEIWSDIRCPFCYIGKRKFEQALEKFEHKDRIEVKWRSFELDPSLKTDPTISAEEHLAENKGISREQVRQMFAQVIAAARETGLVFDFEKNIVANSYHGHRLIQYAQSEGLGWEAEEIMFEAHFSQGKNIDDPEVLQEAGMAIGLEAEALEKLFASDDFGDAVREDQEKAQSLGIRGVPFFVFDHKYAVSGAQPVEAFLQALRQSWDEWPEEKKNPENPDGNFCTTDGICL